MDPLHLIGFILSALMGLSLGLIGGGGSILTVPILVYFFRQDALLATTGSFFVVGMTALFGTGLNARKKNIAIKTGLVFAVPSFAGVYLMRRVVLPMIPTEIPLFSGMVISKAELVMLSFAALMIIASRAMIRSGRTTSQTNTESAAASSPRAALQGFLVGCTTAFVGAGGGFLIVPALVLMLRLPMRLAVGTSLAIIATNSLFAFFISFESQPINWPLLLSIATIGIAGMIFGNRFASRLPEGKLKQGFGYFVLVVGSLILLDQVLRSS